MADFSNLKVGDKVIINLGGWDKIRKIRTVERITPSGLIGLCGRLFYKDGRERGRNRFTTRLEEWTQEKEDEINRLDIERRARNSCIDVFEQCSSNLTYEQSVAILEILKGGKNESHF